MIVSFAVDSVILIGQRGGPWVPLVPVARLSHRPEVIYCNLHHCGELFTRKRRIYRDRCRNVILPDYIELFGIALESSCHDDQIR